MTQTEDLYHWYQEKKDISTKTFTEAKIMWVRCLQKKLSQPPRGYWVTLTPHYHLEPGAAYVSTTRLRVTRPLLIKRSGPEIPKVLQQLPGKLYQIEEFESWYHHEWPLLLWELP